MESSDIYKHNDVAKFLHPASDITFKIYCHHTESGSYPTCMVFGKTHQAGFVFNEDCDLSDIMAKYAQIVVDAERKEK